MRARRGPHAAVPRRWLRDPPGDPRLTLPEADTLTAAFLEQARRWPDRVVVADERRGGRTFRDLVAAVLALAPRLQALDGERVGILLPAGVAADVVYLATLFAGKTPVMVNWTVGPRHLTHSLDLVECRQVLTAEALVTRLQAQGKDLGALEGRLVFLERLSGEVGWRRKLAAGLRSRLSWAPLRKARPPETAVILFTSGSEALPKAVPLSHANLLANLRDMAQVLTLRASDRLLGMLPPFHAFGLTCGVLTALCLGLRTVYHPNPTQGATLARLAAAYQVTMLIGTPTFLHGIVRAASEADLRPLRRVVAGAEKCPDRVYAAFAERCPQAAVLEGYGVTECSPVISVNDERSPRPGTIGRVLPSVQHAIVDVETRDRVPPGGVGLLLVRGPSVFGGYLGHHGPSPFVQLGGQAWYSTGDLVSEDAEGVLTFRGRVKRFVKLGGEMVSLPAVEHVLASVAERDEGHRIAVVATADEARPQLVLFTTRPLELGDVNRHLRDAGLSPLHKIRRIVQLEEFPLLGSGKTDYRAIQALLAEARGRADEPGA